VPERRAGAVRVREIRAADDPAFEAAHRLLRRMFPRRELLPLREWAGTLLERHHRLWTDLSWHLLVAERHGEVVGAASGSYLGNLNVGLVGYVAVARAARGRGLGHRLRTGLRRLLERDARRVHGRSLKAMIGEVRSDNPWLGHVVREEGALALDFDYLQPSLGARHPPVELVLYYQPLHAPRRSLSTPEVRRLLYTIWRRGYRIGRPLSQLVFRRMLQGLEGRARIGQRPVPHRARSPQAAGRSKAHGVPGRGRAS
jgi:GNAT superfamily N-acetyltransferase